MVTKQRLAIAGSTGKMGRALLKTLSTIQSDEVELTVALAREGSAIVGQNIAYNDFSVPVTDQLSILRHIDCLIDFTSPQGTLHYLKTCLLYRVNMVIGSTGFTEAEKADLQAASEKIAIVLAPNMSVGVNVVLELLKSAAQALSHGYDIEIVEMHHRHKVDAPSGTALQMGEVMAQTLNRNLKECAVYSRQGVTGARDPSSIGFATLRGGEVVGDHTVIFAGLGENIEIRHQALSRLTFAQGALRAAQFLKDKRKGLYSMKEVLGLDK